MKLIEFMGTNYINLLSLLVLVFAFFRNGCEAIIDFTTSILDLIAHHDNYEKCIKTLLKQAVH